MVPTFKFDLGTPKSTPVRGSGQNDQKIFVRENLGANLEPSLRSRPKIT